MVAHDLLARLGVLLLDGQDLRVVPGHDIVDLAGDLPVGELGAVPLGLDHADLVRGAQIIRQHPERGMDGVGDPGDAVVLRHDQRQVALPIRVPIAPPGRRPARRLEDLDVARLRLDQLDLQDRIGLGTPGVPGLDLEPDPAALGLDRELVDLPAVLIDEKVPDPRAVDRDPVDAPGLALEPGRNGRGLERALDVIPGLARDRIAELRRSRGNGLVAAAQPPLRSAPSGSRSARRPRAR